MCGRRWRIDAAADCVGGDVLESPGRRPAKHYISRRTMTDGWLPPRAHGCARVGRVWQRHRFQALAFRRSTSSRSSLLGLKNGILFGGTSTLAPVFGLPREFSASLHDSRGQ